MFIFSFLKKLLFISFCCTCVYMFKCVFAGCFSEINVWFVFDSHEYWVGQRLKECYLKYKRQRWDFCEEFTALHFATKWTDFVKFVKPRISSRFFSEWRVFSYDGSATWAECLRKDQRGKSCWYTTRNRPRVWSRTRWSDYISNLALCRLGVEPEQQYMRLMKTVRYFESSWGCCPRDPAEKTGMKMNERMYSIKVGRDLMTMAKYGSRTKTSCGPW